MTENYKKLLLLLTAFGVLALISGYFITTTKQLTQSGMTEHKVVQKADIKTYLNDTYGTEINAQYFRDANSLFCGKSVTSKSSNLDCAGRKGGSVFLLGHMSQTEKRADIETKLVKALSENFILTPTKEYMLECKDSKDVNASDAALVECSIFSNKTVASKVVRVLNLTISVYYFNTDKAVSNFLMLTPKASVEIFEEIFSQHTLKTSFFGLFERVHAGGDGSTDGTGSGNGTVDNTGTQLGQMAADLGVDSISGYTSVVDATGLASALGSGMVSTGPNSACCNAFGDSVTLGEVGGGSGGGSTSGSPSSGAPVSGVCPAPTVLTSVPSVVCNYKTGGREGYFYNDTVSGATCPASGSQGGQLKGATVSYRDVCAAPSTPSAPASVPTATLSSSPSTVSYGMPTTLTWTSTGATGCTASGSWSGSKSVGGSEVTPNLTADQTYNIVCSNGTTSSTPLTIIVDVCPQSTPTWNGSACVMPVGNIISNSCTIPTGSPSCSMNVAWGVTNPSGVVTVVRPYAGNSVLATGVSGNGPYTFPYAPTPYTLNLVDNTTTLDTGTFTASCGIGGYDTLGNVCANPSGDSSITGDYYGPGFFNFTCTNSNGYIVRRDGVLVSQATVGSYTSGTPVSLPITLAGNYQVECLHGDYGVLVPADYFNAPPPPVAVVSITATPRTIAKDSSVTLSWNIQYPTSACTLTAKSVCTNGICNTAQLASQSALNSRLTTEMVDSSTTRRVTTAIRTVDPAYTATYRAVGKKTLKISNTTDFTINCGSAAQTATARVLVTSSNEQ